MGLKNLWAEFKAFAFKGNMIELAVAVVIGAAFSTVINSLVTDVIMPTVGYVVNTASTVAAKAKDVASDTVGLSSTKPAATEPAAAGAAAASAPPAPPAATPGGPTPGGPTPGGPPAPVKIDLKLGPVNLGAFIGALLNFLLVAAAVFLVIVKLLGSVMKKVSRPPAPSEPTTKECQFCLSLIPIKAIKCSQCTADLPAVA